MGVQIPRPRAAFIYGYTRRSDHMEEDFIQ